MAACHSIERAPTATTHVQSSQASPTWRPVIYFSDGRVRKLNGGLSHGEAMAFAEREAESWGEVESFGAQREGMRSIPGRGLSDQELIWGVIMDPNDRIIRLPQVIERVGLKKSAIYKMIAAGVFPKQLKLGFASGWLESEIKAWIEERAREREA